MLSIQRLDSTDPDFESRLSKLVSTALEVDRDVRERVEAIIQAVRERGDEAVLEFARRFDGSGASSLADLEVAPEVWKEAAASLEPGVREALHTAARRLREYAGRQKEASWEYTDSHGNRLGQRVTPVRRAGVYVPGGKASYPSSALMNAIPASVAGVEEIIMTVPAPDGVLDPLVLAAADRAGVHRLFTIGGAQAVAALAYGTETLPAVDKIVGPGNAYVATAKRQVFGQVGIDMIAGPSEILIICDGRTDPDWIVMDLFSQAEHDEDARAMLISPNADFLEAVRSRMEEMVPRQSRAGIIAASLENNGALIHVRDLDEAVNVANRIAPEHLELSVHAPEALLERVENAGAIFMGRHTPEAFGDYCAGPNHVLPTGTSARFSSPLGVQDFQKRSSVIQASPAGARKLAPVAGALARAEGLDAHARSASLRSGEE